MVQASADVDALVYLVALLAFNLRHYGLSRRYGLLFYVNPLVSYRQGDAFFIVQTGNTRASNDVRFTHLVRISPVDTRRKCMGWWWSRNEAVSVIVLSKQSSAC